VPGAGDVRLYRAEDLTQLQKLAEQSGFGQRAWGGKKRLQGLVETIRTEKPARPDPGTGRR
jgi:hypothetical protein